MRMICVRALKRLLAMLLVLVLVLGAFPAALAAESASEYGITLGAEGVTSGYEALDTDSHAIGDNTVDETYVFAFSEESFTVTNVTGALIRGSSGHLVRIDGTKPTSGSFTKGGSRASAYLDGTFGARFTDPAALTAAGYTDLDADATAFYYLYFTTVQYAILIQITPNGAASPVSLAREALGLEIARVTGDGAADWVQSGDRYNGVSASANGFWADMQPILADAQTVYDNDNATADALTAAAESLEAAIAALIPADRVNPTALYEAYQAELNAGRVASNYYISSWEAYEAAMAEAEAVLDGVFENGALLPVSEQETLDTAAQALQNAAADLFSNYEYQYAVGARPLLPALIAEASRAQQADYTAESWAVFADALDAAEAAAASTDELTGTSADLIYREAFDALYDAYYWGLVPTGEVTVNLTVLDPYFACMKTAIQPLWYGATEDVTLSGDYTLEAAAAQVGASVTDDAALYDRVRVYINGIYVTHGYGINPYYNPDQYGKELIWNAAGLTMHPGDTIVVTRNSRPQSNMGANIYTDGASFFQYIDSLCVSNFRTDDGFLTAYAGELLTIGIDKTTGALGRSGITSVADGMTLFVSSVREEMGGNTRPERMKNNGELIVTNENGEAEITLYEEGWVLLSAYDMRDDELGDYDSVNGTYILAGNYHSMNTGAAVWVHVLPSETPDIVKVALQEELDEIYQTCDQTIFPNDALEQLNDLYQTATDGIAAAESTGEARAAQQTGILAIQALLRNVISDNASKLATFRSCLAKLPDDLNLVTAAQQDVVDMLISTYESMSEYLRGCLLVGELERYEQVAALGTLPEAVSYHVNVVVSADTDEAASALQDMTEWLSENSPREDSYANGWELNVGDILERYAAPFTTVNNEKQYSVPFAPNTRIKLNLSVEYSAYYHIRNADSHIITGDGWRIVDDPDGGISFVPRFYMNYNIEGRFAVLVGDTEYEFKSITINGLDDYTESGFVSILDRTSYKDKDYDWVNLWFPDGLFTFDMPYNDVTVTVNWGPVEASGETGAAIDALTMEYNGYIPSNYSDEKWEELTFIYHQGVEAIQTADDPVSVKDEYAALMAEVQSLNAGTLLGSVTVTFSNNTLQDGPFYTETEPFISETINLYDTDTMMTVALRALEVNDFTWGGTGGSGGPYTITYLASVTLGVETLEEKMPGYGGSGWMAMLNNWFVHQGMQEFSVENGGLRNGDKVELVFTCDGGPDVRSGEIGIQDTVMRTISADGGTMSPAFDPEVSEYILALQDGQNTTRLTFEPQWRCFQSRAYKNSYTPSSENYFHSGDTLYLTNGDVIYVASGDPAWPSMSGNDNVSLAASVYRITVITPDATEEVEAMLSGLKTVKYETYASVKDSVETARAAYNALGEEAQSQISQSAYEKLTDAERLIGEYTALDLFKVELADIDTASADIEAARAMVNAYDSMTAAQKANLTVAEAAKIEVLREKLGPAIRYGDANGDRKINTKDVILLRQYIAKYNVASLIDLAAADVNGDGKVNTKDVILLRQYIAKYDVTLGPANG